MKKVNEQQINNYFHQLQLAFPEFETHEKKIFEPSETDFPFSWKDPLKAADNVLKVLARHIGLDAERFDLMFYEQYPEEDVEDPNSVYLKFRNDKKSTLQDYQNSVKKYCINIDAFVFAYADWVIAAIAHEICHLKLLEKGIFDVGDEKLIDVATVYFGFGKLTALASANKGKSLEPHAHKRFGSLCDEEWSFALAVCNNYKR
ncbi:hypothetical protein U1E44_06410 [Arenibacter sp. GZD96]|uniref:hypothetical protein n=1 Tax=Aurantibrevibacter litoralis TaxID=3106030 RepID=UPI002AFFCF62|nr:hypothetical protein [Arenibacter sp. GZD-96]MEA1785715.1 hypothetical protein [Arenibacter sp. GZD-96]